MNLISIFTILTVSLAAVNFFVLAKGRLKTSFKLQILIYSGYCIVESMLAMNSPDQKMIALFVLLDLWAIAAAIMGLRRLKKLDTSPPSAHYLNGSCDHEHHIRS